MNKTEYLHPILITPIMHLNFSNYCISLLPTNNQGTVSLCHCGLWDVDIKVLGCPKTPSAGLRHLGAYVCLVVMWLKCLVISGPHNLSLKHCATHLCDCMEMTAPINLPLMIYFAIAFFSYFYWEKIIFVSWSRFA